MANEKVLLVDDEEEFTSLLSQRMEARGLQVDIAANGVEALDKAKGHDYDVILLDLAMPGMDGIETLKRLLGENEDLQVILLTGHATVQKGVEAVKLGAREVIEKPAELSQLMEKISEAKLDRVVLVEKKMEARIQEILKSKGW